MATPPGKSQVVLASEGKKECLLALATFFSIFSAVLEFY